VRFKSGINRGKNVCFMLFENSTYVSNILGSSSGQTLSRAFTPDQGKSDRDPDVRSEFNSHPDRIFSVETIVSVT
jgi:hypothetical protein